MPETPQNSVVVASEICPSLSSHRRALHWLKSRTSSIVLPVSGSRAVSVRGMRRLNAAAMAYSTTMQAMVACAGVSMPRLMNGRCTDSR